MNGAVKRSETYPPAISWKLVALERLLYPPRQEGALRRRPSVQCPLVRCCRACILRLRLHPNVHLVPNCHSSLNSKAVERQNFGVCPVNRDNTKERQEVQRHVVNGLISGSFPIDCSAEGRLHIWKVFR
ncbi:hypothetical protein TGRH88_075900 [Toxoplasma gondii]|uniref:Uncharacterized protein n=1 Tax=Toxoplasma gondii TaxID=5811 RepID=A0A7J6K4N5_TOXGO|nr:hypothetical protein TGRH88_075900 [Toxoplasma gondii]